MNTKTSENFKLKRTLTTIDIFSIATGAMISSGLFILPSLAYEKVGTGIILSYLLASLFMIPAMFAKTELATAMPKAGGTYFYINRSMGPFFGTFSGFTNWFSLALKGAFALVGIGLFITPFYPEASMMQIKGIAIFFTLVFTILNIIGVKESGRFQVTFVLILISLLTFYIVSSITHINIEYILPLIPKDRGFFKLTSTAGMIFISFGGLTKIAAMAEEVKDPGKPIPKGMFSAYSIVTILYISTVFVTVGILPPEAMVSSVLPISDSARVTTGSVGYVLLSLAAITAFITTANASIMSASRTPMAMAEDHLLPSFFARVNPKTMTPINSIITTSLFMCTVILVLDLEHLVKAASTMMLILFCLVCISLIFMRASKISTYKPKFISPFFPYMPILGIIIYTFLIADMGKEPLLMAGGFFLFSAAWYFLYSRKRAEKESALIHIVENITNKAIKSSNLDDELKDILIERDDIVEDRFDKIIHDTVIIDSPGEKTIPYTELFTLIARNFSERLGTSYQEIYDLLIEREQDSTTVIAQGLAIPHIIISGKKQFDIIIIRSKAGIIFPNNREPVHIVFALAGSKDERNFHLQALMAIAQIVQNDEFTHDWIQMKTTKDLKNLILLAQRVRQNSL